MDFAASIARVKEILVSVSSTKSQDAIVSKALFTALGSVLLSCSKTSEQILLAPSNLAVLEDACSNRYLVIGKALQITLVSIYHNILLQAPGYAVRNTINSMLGIANNKITTVSSRDCAAAVIGKLMESRSFDCGSLINDVISCLSKVARGNDLSSRIVAINALSSLLCGAGVRISDCHAEILKLGSRYCSDKCADVRIQVAVLISSIARHSAGCSSVPPESLVAATIKGIEDENLIVQDCFIQAYASILYEQFRAYIDQQEKAKIGLARGADGPTAPAKKRMSVSMPKLSISAPKKLVEDFQFRSVITHLLKSVVKSVACLRNGFLAVLSQFVRESINHIDRDDLEWLLHATLGTLQDPSVSSLPYEEMAYLKARLAHVLSASIGSQLNETQLLVFAAILLSYVASMEQRGEYELQLALGELCHVLTILGESAAAIIDDVQAAIALQLRHSSFGVRSAAAHVVCSLASSIPGIASNLMRASFENAKTQSNQLLQVDSSESPSAPSEDEDVLSESGRRRTPKESERLQRMYFFHGHTLVISMLLKSEDPHKTSFPTNLISEVFQFGLSLLQLDVLATPLPVRNVSCSVVRAGSLIVSSCLNRGYVANKPIILKVLVACESIFRQAISAKSGSTDDLLFELMSVEAALVCVATLLWSCPDALEHEDGCLPLIIESLEKTFRLVKSKYQPKFRNHFRFRILHAIVLECFAWLPPGSFPSSCQQLFVEALRVFRDGVVSGSECSCLAEMAHEDYAILNTATASSAALSSAKLSAINSPDVPCNTDMLVLRLENYAVALPRKESEALLASFNKDKHVNNGIRSQYLPGLDWNAPRAPCSLIESRVLDAAIAVVGCTFGHQTIEFQEKCINLCIQMLASVTKTSSTMSMFSSEEEKRRKERRSFTTAKGVVACFHAIIKSFPFEYFASPSFNLSWAQTAVDSLVELSNHSCLEIRVVAAQVVSHLAAQMTRSSLLDTVFSQISSSISISSEKKGETMIDNAGSLLALAELCMNASSRPRLQTIIFTNLMDCLRRVDLSTYYRATGVVALSATLKYCGEQIISNEAGSALSLLERLCHVIEINVVSINILDDGELLSGSLLRLCGVMLNLVLKLSLVEVLPADSADHSRAGSEDLDNLILRLVRCWEVFRSQNSHPEMRLEALNFLKSAVKYRLFRQFVSTTQTISIIRQTLENDSQGTINALLAAVHICKELCQHDPILVFQSGIDVVLFKLLGWAIGSTSSATTLIYSGLDIRCCNQLGLVFSADKSRLLCDIKQTIRVIYTSVLAADLDKFALRIALFTRAVALSLRSEAGAGAGAGEAEDDSEAVADNQQSSSSGASQTFKPNMSAAADALSMTPQQFAAKVRDLAAVRAGDVSVNFLQVKCFAVELASSVLGLIVYNRMNSPHVNLTRAREFSRSALVALPVDATDELLSQVPCFASLFINDLVNLACACATFTVNDKTLISLQVQAICLLENTISLFFSTVDPDIQDIDVSQSSASNKILLQFISQIVSAVRPCLGSQVSPSLARSSAFVVCELIRGGLITDKVSVRRLLKPLLTLADDAGGHLSLRANSSVDYSDEQTAELHVVSSLVYAKLFLLTNSNTGNRFVDSTVRSTVQALLSENASHLFELWRGLVFDSARVLQAGPSRRPDDAGGCWPVSTIETDARRGGLIYHANVNPDTLLPTLETSLPSVLHAVAISKQFGSENAVGVFSIASASLSHICSLHENLPNLIPFETTMISSQTSLLNGLCSLSTNEAVMGQIPSEQWVLVLQNIAIRLLPRVRSSCSPLLHVHAIVPVADVLFALLKLVDPMDETQSKRKGGNITSLVTDETEMVAWVWTSALSIIASLFPQNFQNMTTLTGSVDQILKGELPPLNQSSTRHDSCEILDLLFEEVSEPLAVITKLIHVVSVVGRSQNIEIKCYVFALLLNISPAVAVYLSGAGLGKQLPALNAFVCDEVMLLKQTVEDDVAQQYSSLALHDLLLWEMHFSSTVSSSAESVGAAVDSVLSIWATTVKTLPVDSIISPVFFSTVVLKINSLHPVFVNTILRWIISAIQSDPQCAGFVLVAEITIPILCMLCNATPVLRQQGGASDKGMVDDVSELLAIQAIFAGINVFNDVSRKVYLELIVPSLCDVISRRAVECAVVQHIGRGLAHVARAFPEAFRDAVSSLNENQRSNLQNLLRMVLQSQAAGSVSGSTVGATAQPAVKRIDLSRYKPKDS